MRGRPRVALALVASACGASGSAATSEAPVPDGGVSVEAGSPPAIAPYPEPGTWPKNRGPGGPRTPFGADRLYVACAHLDGGPTDVDHHNIVQMFDGYLALPWAPESGNGGLSFFDVSDPCKPQRVGVGLSETMRETHSIAFSTRGGAWAATNALRANEAGGVQIWDVSDVTAPRVVTAVDVPGFAYPDGYTRVVFSLFWQGPVLYAAGADNGLFIIDTSDPRQPRIRTHWNAPNAMRIGQVQAVGNLLYLAMNEGTRSIFIDISDPYAPQPIGGGDFLLRDGAGEPRSAYFSNVTGGRAYFARKDAAGGLIVFDVHDPAAPTFLGDIVSRGNGGYVYVKDNLAFVGESSFASIYDVSDPRSIRLVRELTIPGDLDTIVPIGNVAFLSADDGAPADQGTAIAPFHEAVDVDPPRVTWGWPRDGAADLTTTSRFGLTFNEFIDPKSAWAGSVRLHEESTGVHVDGVVSVQEDIVNFTPVEPLRPGTKYVLEVPAGGIADYNGNAIASPFLAHFRTAGTR